MTVAELLKRDRNNLDLVRIILAVMVIWSHAFQFSIGGLLLEPFQKFVKVSAPGGLAVEVFFFISGLLVANSLIKKQSISKFIVSRFFRLFPAFFVLIFLTVFLIGPIVSNIPISVYFSDSLTWKYLYENLILNIQYVLPGCFSNNIEPNNVNSSLWSLTYEVASYLFLAAIYIITNKKLKTISIAYISIVFLLAIIPLQYLLMLFQRSYLIAVEPIACFAVGVLFAINQDKIKLDLKLLLGLSLLTLLFWRFTTLIHLLFPITISVFMLLFSADKTVLKLKPKYDISYGLYIWNALVVQSIVYYFGQMNVYILFVFALIVTSILAFTSYVLIEHRAINYGYKLGNKIVESNIKYERLIFYFGLLIAIILLAKLS